MVVADSQCPGSAAIEESATESWKEGLRVTVVMWELAACTIQVLIWKMSPCLARRLVGRRRRQRLPRVTQQSGSAQVVTRPPSAVLTLDGDCVPGRSASHACKWTQPRAARLLHGSIMTGKARLEEVAADDSVNGALA